MPTYTYEGEDGRYYPTLGLTPEPGGSYELPANPGDGRWTPPDPDPDPDPEPAADADPAAPKARRAATKAGEQ